MTCLILEIDHFDLFPIGGQQSDLLPPKSGNNMLSCVCCFWMYNNQGFSFHGSKDLDLLLSRALNGQAHVIGIESFPLHGQNKNDPDAITSAVGHRFGDTCGIR